MRYILSLAMLLLLQVMEARAELQLCAMTRQQAVQSPLCVRWHFACQVSMDGKPSGAAAAINAKDRYRLILLLAFQRAQHDCDTFSYQEALAAVQVLLLIDAPSAPPTFQPPIASKP